MRRPVVAGLRAGAGATTLAAALHGVDGGVWRGGPVDVLVTRCDPRALPAGIPVVALVADGPAPTRAGGGPLVVLPVVPRWRGPAAAVLLGLNERQLPADLRPVAVAVRAVAAALVRSGVLQRPCAAPAGRLGSPAASRRGPAVGPRPVRAPRPEPVLLHRAVPVVPRLVAGRPVRWAGPALRTG